MGCRIFALGLAACVAIAASALAEDEPDGEQLVEALNAVFGIAGEPRERYLREGTFHAGA
jgi:hypothetical protein